MKCVFYEFKTTNHCAECKDQDNCEPETFVNNVLKDITAPHSEWEFVNTRPFDTFSQGDQYNKVLKFKYAPPKISELLEGLIPKPYGSSSTEQWQSLQEFCPEYPRALLSSHHNNQRIQHHTSFQNSSSSPNPDNCFVNSNFKKSDRRCRGTWCVYSGLATRSSKQKKLFLTKESTNEIFCMKTAKESVCSILSKRAKVSSSWKQQNRKNVIQSLKSEYNISNYHRGKWLITSKENKISSLWREICKLISDGELVHCNAKYQEVAKEIWLYCDFIDCLDINEILKCKLNIVKVLSYYVHPHGIIVRA